jgi:hypothetical protein
MYYKLIMYLGYAKPGDDHLLFERIQAWWVPEDDGRCGEENNFLALSGIESRTISP